MIVKQPRYKSFFGHLSKSNRRFNKKGLLQVASSMTRRTESRDMTTEMMTTELCWLLISFLILWKTRGLIGHLLGHWSIYQFNNDGSDWSFSEQVYLNLRFIRRPDFHKMIFSLSSTYQCQSVRSYFPKVYFPPKNLWKCIFRKCILQCIWLVINENQGF